MIHEHDCFSLALRKRYLYINVCKQLSAHVLMLPLLGDGHCATNLSGIGLKADPAHFLTFTLSHT